MTYFDRLVWIAKPLSFVLVVFGILALFMVGLRVASTDTYGDVYRVARITHIDGSTFYRVQCARWYHPGYNHSEYFFVNSLNPDEAVRARAEAYAKMLEAAKCVPQVEQTIKR